MDRGGRSPGATRRIVLGAAVGSLGAGGRSARAAATPRRIVSLGACLDVMLVHLADRGQIAALSHHARDPQSSTVFETARTLPRTWESAEEVLALRPDLVLASKHTALATRNALRELDLKTGYFPVANSVDESLQQVLEVGDLVGHPERGRRLAARIREAIAAAAPPAGARPLQALVFQPNGFAAGKGTLLDEMLRRTGFENVAGRYGLKRWGNVPLERLLADPPQVLLAGEASPRARSWADRVMSHPALAQIAPHMRQARFPERLLYCGGPVLIQTAAALAAARRQVLGAAA